MFIRLGRRAFRSRVLRDSILSLSLRIIESLPADFLPAIALPFLGREKYPGVGYHAVGRRIALVTQPRRQMKEPEGAVNVPEGIYTGRLIYLKLPIRLEDLTGAAPPKGIEPEQWFRDWLDGRVKAAGSRPSLQGGRERAEEFIRSYDNCSGASASNAFRTFAHEYCHWRMLESTSLGATIEAVSWRVRYYQLILCERLHLETGIPRTVSPVSISTLRSWATPSPPETLIRFASKESWQVTLWDLVCHVLHLLVHYPRLISVVVEPPTWLLIEPSFSGNPESWFGKYFEEGSVDLGFASTVANYSRSYLAERGSTLEDLGNLSGQWPRLDNTSLNHVVLARDGLLKAVRSALDDPGYSSSFSTPLVDGDTLLRLRAEKAIVRLKTVLDGGSVTCAGRWGKTLTSAIGYALRPAEPFGRPAKAVSRDQLSTVLGILKRERSILRVGVRLAVDRESSPAVSWPTVFANIRYSNGRVGKIRYDPFTRLTGDESDSPIGHLKVVSTGKELDRFDDLVGDLPGTLGTALHGLLLQGSITGMDRKTSSRTRRRLEELLGVQVGDSDGSADGFLDDILNQLETVRASMNLTFDRLRAKPSADNVLDFYRYWATLVSTLGERVLETIPEHGMWT